MRKLVFSLTILILSLVISGGVLVSYAEAQTGGCSTTHIVLRGENLYRIALHYRTTIADIQARNSISNPNRIYAGQRLCISGGFVPEPNPIPNPNTPPGVGRVISSVLNIRNGPGLQYGILGQVRYGSTYPLVGRSSDSNWYQILYNAAAGRYAWVYARLMSATNPQSLPVVNSPTAPTLYSAQVPLASNATTYSSPLSLTAIAPYELSTGTHVLVIGRTDAADWFQIRLNSGTVWLRHDAFPNAMARFEFPVTA